MYQRQAVSVDGFALIAAARYPDCLAAVKQLLSLLDLWTNIQRRSQGRESFAVRKPLGYAAVMAWSDMKNIQSGGSWLWNRQVR
ncbi:MAG TPA: hypothetical protein VHY19_04665 [Steroidobacteraceae bacterium]|jgi:hypothetical protein|nr:hypothetical protein [Steroidobacteraceae bacterium]